MIPLGTCHESSEGVAGWASIVIGTIVVGGRLSKGNTNSIVQKVITDERSNRLFLIEYLEWSNSLYIPSISKIVKHWACQLLVFLTN